MDLHIGYEAVEPYALDRTDVPDEKSRQAGYAPKAMLKADKQTGRPQLASETALSGVPDSAWAYRFGNRSALERVLYHTKEQMPSIGRASCRKSRFRYGTIWGEGGYI